MRVFGGMSKGTVGKILERCREADFPAAIMFAVDARYAVASTDTGMRHLYLRLGGRHKVMGWSRNPKMFARDLEKRALKVAAKWTSDPDAKPRILMFRPRNK